MSLMVALEEWQSLTWFDVLRIQADGKVRCGVAVLSVKYCAGW